jgi:hypothetical protein
MITGHKRKKSEASGGTTSTVRQDPVDIEAYRGPTNSTIEFIPKKY